LCLFQKNAPALKLPEAVVSKLVSESKIGVEFKKTVKISAA